MNTNSSQGHPKGLYLLFFTEMWERFSYYGMRAIFMLFMIKALLLSEKESSNIYGSYTGLVYLTPLLGGYLSDRFLGNRRSIEIGGLMMALGQFILFFSASTTGSMAVTLMWAGLTLLIIGNGFFKPNISTMVGNLYPEGDRRVDSAFTIFYMGINLGAFFSPLVCGSLAEKVDFKWGFLAAGIGMVISLVSFAFYKNKLLVGHDGKPIGLPVKRLDLKNILIILGSTLVVFFLLNLKSMSNFSIVISDSFILAINFSELADKDVIGYFIFGALIIMPMIIMTDKSLTGVERSRIGVIFILCFFVIFFWMSFEQAGASLTLFADKQTDRMVGTWEMPASWFQSINPLGIIVLAPLFSILWGTMHKRNMEPSSPMKMAWGLTLLTLGYVVIAIAVNGVDSSVKVSMWWLIALYILHTMGELCLSPIGLSMVSKLSPARFSSLLMGTWFLANACANKLAGTLSALIPPGAGEKGAEAGAEVPSIAGFQINNLYDFFMVFIVLSGIAAIILFLMSNFLKKRMHGIN